MTQRKTLHTVAVQFGDCDPAGIVFFPQYMVMFNGLLEQPAEVLVLATPHLDQLEGVDINPFLIQHTGAVCLDALITIRA